MAKTIKTDANWTSVDIETLPDPLKARHIEYKTAYTHMKDARERFEKAMSDAISPPDGKRVVFGYNFGKLSIAVVADDRIEKRTTVGTQSLANWIASQRASGRDS